MSWVMLSPLVVSEKDFVELMLIFFQMFGRILQWNYLGLKSSVLEVFNVFNKHRWCHFSNNVQMICFILGEVFDVF